MMAEHVLEALKELGFEELYEPVKDFNESKKIDVKPRRISMEERAGLTTAQLIEKQKLLFANSPSAFPHSPFPKDS